MFFSGGDNGTDGEVVSAGEEYSNSDGKAETGIVFSAVGVDGRSTTGDGDDDSEGIIGDVVEGVLPLNTYIGSSQSSLGILTCNTGCVTYDPSLMPGNMSSKKVTSRLIKNSLCSRSYHFHPLVPKG